MASPGPSLFSPFSVGALELPNRMVMAPMTRNRAGAGHAPTALNAMYYAQRASAGLIITEASQVSPQGVGYPRTPGMYSDEQVAGWRLVTSAVHARGGRIFAQLWHVGRVSHPLLQPGRALPVAPSAIAPEGKAMTPAGLQPFVTPRALATHEIPDIVAQFAHAARQAKAAGFDGVEIHGANGYLIDQFIRDGSNHRTDQYGGSAVNRVRLLREIAEAVVAVWGPHRVGVRLSPHSRSNGMSDSNPLATFTAAVRALDTIGLAYLHIVEPVSLSADARRIAPALRAAFHGPTMANGGHNRASADAIIATEQADLVAFGVLFLANPDLVDRFRIDAPLNTADRATFYTGEHRGYTDYPVYRQRTTPPSGLPSAA
jgi:N-ethylmaleimide reductase